MIDRFLRNNLGNDDDYAEYSKALDSLCGAQPAQAGAGVTDEKLTRHLGMACRAVSKAWKKRFYRAIEQSVLAKRIADDAKDVDA